jgi:hypothetical protein
MLRLHPQAVVDNTAGTCATEPGRCNSLFTGRGGAFFLEGVSIGGFLEGVSIGGSSFVRSTLSRNKAQLGSGGFLYMRSGYLHFAAEDCELGRNVAVQVSGRCLVGSCCT